MRKSTVMFLLPLLFAALSVRAAEMFEDYPRKIALGYVADEVNMRYWFVPGWGLDVNGGITRQSQRQHADDSVVISNDHADAAGYSFGVAGLRALKTFDYFNLNLKAGFSFSYENAHNDPEGPNNMTSQVQRDYSLHVGPEVEVKVPYLSRLVIVSSIQAAFRVTTARTMAEGVGGNTLTRNKSKVFSLQGDSNTLDEFFHLGIRYYF
jgi:hypothetical protein